VGVLTRQKRRSRRAAERAIVKLRETQAGRCQSVEMGRLDLTAVTPKIGEPQVVEAAEQRRVFLEKALDLLTPTATQDAFVWSTKARIHTLLKQPSEALATYEAGLARQPDQIASRYEYAALLFGQGRMQDARRELSIVLGQQPNHSDAKSLIEHVGRAIAAGKDRPQLP
jgi:predicted Zn-dependent protease